MTKSSIKVVCDAGPLIHLDELNCLELFADFEEIVLPPSKILEEQKGALYFSKQKKGSPIKGFVPPK